jgi:galactose oxidase
MLVVVDGSTSDGAAIQVTTATFTDGRDKWCLTTTTSGVYMLVNSKSARVVDVADFSKSDGSKIHQWFNVQGINQQFRISTDIGSPAQTWQFPVGTPVLAASAAHLPDGRILIWASKSRGGFGVDPSLLTWTSIYNPATGG